MEVQFNLEVESFQQELRPLELLTEYAKLFPSPDNGHWCRRMTVQGVEVTFWPWDLKEIFGRYGSITVSVPYTDHTIFSVFLTKKQIKEFMEFKTSFRTLLTEGSFPHGRVYGTGIWKQVLNPEEVIDYIVDGWKK